MEFNGLNYIIIYLKNQYKLASGFWARYIVAADLGGLDVMQRWFGILYIIVGIQPDHW